ncbi:MAG: hypothetical protein ABIK67_06590 [candidate division WOR-3 bacterium]
MFKLVTLVILPTGLCLYLPAPEPTPEVAYGMTPELAPEVAS